MTNNLDILFKLAEDWMEFHLEKNPGTSVTYSHVKCIHRDEELNPKHRVSAAKKCVQIDKLAIYIGKNGCWVDRLTSPLYNRIPEIVEKGSEILHCWRV